MNRTLRLAGLLGCVSLAGAAGCGSLTKQDRWATGMRPHAHKQSLAQDACDHNNESMKVSRHDSRAIVDDLDTAFMTDRPSRLTRWHDR